MTGPGGRTGGLGGLIIPGGGRGLGLGRGRPGDRPGDVGRPGLGRGLGLGRTGFGPLGFGGGLVTKEEQHKCK